MYSLSIPEAKAFIAAVAVEANENVMVQGEPGCGKTEAIVQLTQELDAVYCPFLASQHTNVDMHGYPGEQDGWMRWFAPSTIPFVGNPRFPTDRLILLHLDEINSASKELFATLMQVLGERRVAEHHLMPNVRVVACGNRVGDKGVANRTPTTVANRMTWIEVVVDVQAWCDWMATQGAPPECIAFYQFRKELLSTFMVPGPGGAGLVTTNETVFSTPRSATRAWLKYYADPKLSAIVKRAGMAGSIGDGPAAEAWGFIEVWSSLEGYIPRILARPATIELPAEGSLRYAVTVALSGEMNKRHVGACHTFLKRLDPEFVVLAWTMAARRDPTLFQTEEFIDFSKTYKTVFR
jgi:hypothetical protein